MLKKLIERSERIVSSRFDVIVWDKEREKLEEKALVVLRVLREIG